MNQTIKTSIFAALLAVLCLSAPSPLWSAHAQTASAPVAPLATPAPTAKTQLTEIAWEAYGEVLKSANKVSVVLYTQDGCPRCQLLEEQLVRLADKFPGLNFVKIEGTIKYRSEQLPVLDVVSTELLWVFTKKEYAWTEDQLSTFLAQRETFGRKEYEAYSQEMAAQRHIDAAIAAKSDDLDQERAKIEAWNEVYLRNIHNLAEDQMLHLRDLNKERAASSGASLAEIERRELALIDATSKEYETQVEELNKRILPHQSKIEAIQKSAAAKFLSEKEAAHNARWNALFADRDAAKQFDNQGLNTKPLDKK